MLSELYANRMVLNHDMKQYFPRDGPGDRKVERLISNNVDTLLLLAQKRQDADAISAIGMGMSVEKNIKQHGDCI